MVTRAQQLKNLQERRINAIKAREKERQRNDDRVKEGLSRDAGITLAQNLQNRRLLAINQLIVQVRKGFLINPGRIQPFINAAMSRFETQSSIERLRVRKVTRLASAEGISRQEAAKSIRLAQSRFKGILGGKSITRLTTSDVMKLSPRQRKILGIKIKTFKEKRPRLSSIDPKTKLGKSLDLITLGSVTGANINQQQEKVNKQVEDFNKVFGNRTLSEQEFRRAQEIERGIGMNQTNIDKRKKQLGESKKAKVSKFIFGKKALDIDAPSELNNQRELLRDLKKQLPESKGFNRKRIELLIKGIEKQTIPALERGENPFKIKQGTLELGTVGVATAATRVAKIKFLGKQKMMDGKIITDLIFFSKKGKRVGVARGVTLQKGSRGETLLIGKAGKLRKTILRRKPKVKRIRTFAAIEESLSKPTTFQIKSAIDLVRKGKKAQIQTTKNVRRMTQLSKGAIGTVKGGRFFKVAVKFPSGKFVRTKAKSLGVDRFASISTVLTKGNLSKIIGKTITARGFKAEFIGLIKGQKRISKINFTPTKAKQYTKALKKVLSAVAAAEAKAATVSSKAAKGAKGSAALTGLIAKQSIKTGVTAIKTKTPITGKKSVVATKQELVSMPKQAERQPQKILQAQGQVPKQAQRQLSRTKQIQKTKQKALQKVAQQAKQAQAQKQKIRLKLEQKTILKTVTTRGGVPRLGSRLRFLRGLKLKSKKKVIMVKKSSRAGAYNVWARPLKKKGQKKRPALIKVNKKPLTKKRAEDTRNYLLDTSLGRTGQIKRTSGKGRRGRRAVPVGYAARTRAKFRTHRRVRGKRIPLRKGRVIERSRRLLDTRQEVQRINVRKRIAQINKSPLIKKRKITLSQRNVLLKRLEKARRVKAQKNRR